jgi:hypothetical protein
MKARLYTTTLCFALLFLASARVNGQSLHPAPRHEISLQLSDGTPLDIIWAIGQAFSSWNEEQIHSGGFPYHLGVGYRYKVFDKLSIGVDLSFQNFNKTYKLSKSGGREARGKKTMTAFLIMPVAKYIYVKRGIVQLYSEWAFGVGIVNDKNKVENSGEEPTKSNTTTLAFQLNPIALRVGRRFGGFLEFGIGFQGFVTVGASMKF